MVYTQFKPLPYIEFGSLLELAELHAVREIIALLVLNGVDGGVEIK